MLQINKLRADHVIDFAAEELKKYLRMLMPGCGEIGIAYAPDATDGFRLGLLEDFSLENEAKDVVFDDVLHIDTDEQGGIIAGSNLRSVLLAVYQFLKENGCRWLYPGVDGEYIPIADIHPVRYHKMADTRVRAQCNEGGEYQQSMIDVIDFTPKIGLNSFMIEFDNPRVYYDQYYNHWNNTANREPEPVHPDTVLQWKRQCEVEIAKRGLIFQDMGHGWTAEPFGIDTSWGWIGRPDQEIPEESRDFVAMMNGKRKLFNDIALNTNFCMSNPRARAKVVKAVSDYAEANGHVDFLHVWLADGLNNHCECDECRKMIPSDYYAMLLNEIDEELTRRDLPTRIVFISYVDSTWAPEFTRINHPERFYLLLAAITRTYTQSPDGADDAAAAARKYDRNKNHYPSTLGEYMGHANAWQKMSPGSPKVCYEYHFWWPQYCDLGTVEFAKRIYEDVAAYRREGFDGITEDGSQRSFFPNGFCFYVYGAALFDKNVSFEELTRDYFSHAYGEHWEEIHAYLSEISRLFDYNFLVEQTRRYGNFLSDERAEAMDQVPALLDAMLPKIHEWRKARYRVQTVSMQLLEHHAEFCRGIAKAGALRCRGKEVEAYEAFREHFIEFGKREQLIDLYYDHGLCTYAFKRAMYHKPGTAVSRSENNS